MDLLEQCDELFKTSNLYEVIGVTKAASEAEIRRGYYKMSLKVHPDRAPGDKQATAKFQALGKVYALLSDQDQRVIYNEQGIVDEESDSLDRNWEEYWRTMFPSITVQQIEEFEKSYRGSEEEQQDLKRIYEEHQGNMNRIMQHALCATQEDEPRISAFLQSAIDSEELPAYKAFTHESTKKKNDRKRKAERERLEAEELQQELGMDSNSDSLVALIKSRQQTEEKNFNSFLGDLEAKYCKKKPSGKGKGKGKK